MDRAKPALYGQVATCYQPPTMLLRLLVILIALAGFLAAGQAIAVEEQSRGWGSAWIIPHSTEERVARERSDRFDEALNAQDWATVAKILKNLEQSNPKSWELQSIEAYVATLRRRYLEAVTCYNRALAFLPKSNRTDRSKLYVDRSTAQALNGSYHAARVDLEKAIALDQNNVLAHNNYAWLLATCPDGSVRDGQRAVQHARGASESLKHGSPMVLDTLAAAEAEIGDFRSAVKDEKRALSLAGSNRSLYNQHLQSYMKASPVRDTPEPPKTLAPLKKS